MSEVLLRHSLGGGAYRRLTAVPHVWVPRIYRGTSLIKNTPLPGPYSRTIPRVLW